MEQKSANYYTFGFSDPYLKSYLKKVREIPQLTEEEWKTIPFQIKENKEAAKRMVEGNMRLPLKHIIFLIKRHRIVEKDVVMDLIQAGNYGILCAVENFDAGRGFRFSTYADFWIKYETGKIIKNYYNDKNYVEIDSIFNENIEFGQHLDRIHSSNDFFSATDNWIQSRYLGRLLSVLTPFESKVVRMNYIYNCSKKQKERETGLKSVLLNKILKELLEKLMERSTNMCDS